MNSLFVLMFVSGFEATVVDLYCRAIAICYRRVVKVYIKLFNCIVTVSIELSIEVLTADARLATSFASRKVWL